MPVTRRLPRSDRTGPRCNRTAEATVGISGRDRKDAGSSGYRSPGLVTRTSAVSTGTSACRSERGTGRPCCERGNRRRREHVRLVAHGQLSTRGRSVGRRGNDNSAVSRLRVLGAQACVICGSVSRCNCRRAQRSEGVDFWSKRKAQSD